jgi:type I restriction enzyme S subunit
MENQNNLPKLRFPTFSGVWQKQRLSDIISRVIKGVEVEPEEYYKQIGIRSHGKGIFHKNEIKGRDLGNKRVFWIVENALIVNIVFAWEHAVAKTTIQEVGMIASHRFPMYIPKESKSSVDYLLHFFLTPKGKALLELASPGGAGRNKTLGQSEFLRLSFFVPSTSEQQKIASFFTTIDQKISQLKQKKTLLEQYKKSVIQKIFSYEIRFKDDEGQDFPKWEKKKLEDCLDYIQPTKYIVNNTEYDNSYITPVLTAGKSFILGYTNETEGIYNDGLPVIIFDDFTTSTQFVDFAFKVKSSAMKILVTKPNINVNIKFIFEAMRTLNYEIGGHERHWISKFAPLGIDIPSLPEQAKIANFLSAIDEKIICTQKQIEKAEVWKKGLLQKMFV